MSKNTKSYSLVSGSTLLTALFVCLKVFGKIDWSWWFVFAPMWGPLALALAVVLIIGIGMVIGGICVAIFTR